MRLRELEKKDAPLMFEWMQDQNVIQALAADFGHMKIENCLAFIESARVDENNKHFAIVDDQDEYLGTISLKNIDWKNKTGEYAISIRSKAMGTGVARNATEELLRRAFTEMEINKVYLCVFPENIRARKFYEKCNFVYEGTFRNHIITPDGMVHDLMWFSIIKEEYLSEDR